jgi:hypothetical protein
MIINVFVKVIKKNLNFLENLLKKNVKKCKKIKGFTMKSSCAPYKNCKGGKTNKKLTYKKNIDGNNICLKGGDKKTKKKYLFNPNNPKKSFDVYVDKNEKDTISIKYKTLNDVKNTIKKLEKLYKSNKYTHKRIGQVAMIMKVRLNVLKDKKKKQYQLADKYYTFLKKRTKFINDIDRKKLIFKLY